MAEVLQRRGLARAALFGLATGLVLWAVIAAVSGIAVRKADHKMHSAAEISSAWDRVLMLVVNEHEAMNDYLRAPDLDGIDPVASAVGSAAPDLAWLARHSAPQSTNRITLIADTYGVFTNDLKSVVAASRAKSRTDVAVLADEASLSAAALRKQLTVEIQLQHLRVNAMLAENKTIQRVSGRSPRN